MKRTIQVIGIILILLLSSLSFSTIGEEETGSKTIYVNDDGGADYTRIQDAIDNASEGDTVIVYSGIYYETVEIKKERLILKGISQEFEQDFKTEKPIIDAGRRASAIACLESNCIISGFQLQRASFGLSILGYAENNIVYGNNCTHNGNGIQIDSPNNIIIGNNITNNGKGLISTDTYNNTIKQNNILNNSNYGIDFRKGYNCNIMYNNIRGHIIGIVLAEPFGKGDNKIISNIISNNTCGLYILGSSRNLVEKNNFITNHIRQAEIVWDPINDDVPPVGNIFDSNYWSNWHLNLPKPIIMKRVFMKILSFPYFITLDWHPAKEPYNIPIGGK